MYRAAITEDGRLTHKSLRIQLPGQYLILTTVVAMPDEPEITRR